MGEEGEKEKSQHWMATTTRVAVPSTEMGKTEVPHVSVKDQEYMCECVKFKVSSGFLNGDVEWQTTQAGCESLLKTARPQRQQYLPLLPSPQGDTHRRPHFVIPGYLAIQILFCGLLSIHKVTLKLTTQKSSLSQRRMLVQV